MAESNVAVATWLQRLAPDVAATVRRFPFAIVLAAGATATFLLATNYSNWLDVESWMRLFLGLATAAVCAVGGVLFAESRPEAKRAAIVLAYVLPVAVAALMQVRDWGLVVPFTLVPASILWLAVSPVTRIGRGAAREEQQNRFWWLNERAITTAALAGLAFCIIAVGIAAIERSLSVLFGVETSQIFNSWVLPFTGLFLTPVYWLATLPRLNEFDPADLERPDFVAGAVGFMGQFVLVPFLAIYAAILLVYAGQIVITQRLPEGMIGWMVLGFVVAGAATSLVLHPAFMRRRPLVRLFHRAWWWLTVIPLVLFAIAVWVRVDAYGLTSERLMLSSGGIWGALLALAFLFGREDIRLIPALAGAILLVFSIGPWSYSAMPNADQGKRLGALLALKADPTASVSSPAWDEAQLAEAKSAMFYLDNSPGGRETLTRVLLDNGFIYNAEAGPYRMLAELGYPLTVEPALEPGEIVSVPRSRTAEINVSATPFYLGPVSAYYASKTEPGFSLSIEAGVLYAWEDGAMVGSQDLSTWASRLPTVRLDEPWVDFVVGTRRFRLVLSSASWEAGDAGARIITNLTGELFSDAPGVMPN